MSVKEKLFDAFEKDHALLGKGLFDLRNKLASGALAGAKKIASKLDREAGSHIAFEESDFYPALAPFLSKEEIEAMYNEHANGLALIHDILMANALDNNCSSSAPDLIVRVDKMQEHVSDCGELFGAMGGLTPEEHEHLLARLDHWRRVAPAWTEFSGKPPTPGL